MPQTSRHGHGCRISDEWTLKGMRAAILENELLRVLVLLDRGAEILEFRYKPLDVDPMLRLPGGLRNPTRDTLSIHSSGGSYLDYYAGGWQEILPNGGPPTMYKGAEYGQHGEVCLIPWTSEVLEDSPERVTLRCTVRPVRTPLYLERTMTLVKGKAALFLDERLTNEAGESLDMMWGHHVAFGLPFLEEGALIDTSARQLWVEGGDSTPSRRLAPGQQTSWPIAQSSSGAPLDMSIVPPHSDQSSAEMAYLSGFDGPAWYAITNPTQRAGFGMHWDAAMFPYLWLWQEFGAGAGYPWWKRAYTMALEPWTSYPTHGLPGAVERGAQLTLAPGEQRTTQLVAVAYASDRHICLIDADGTVHPATDA